MKNSPTPWSVEETTIDRRVVDANGTPIFGLIERDGRQFMVIPLQENAERIVACVNACAGIPTEDLQQLTHGELHWDKELNHG
jgi:hypothetical protein